MASGGFTLLYKEGMGLIEEVAALPAALTAEGSKQAHIFMAEMQAELAANAIPASEVVGWGGVGGSCRCGDRPANRANLAVSVDPERFGAMVDEQSLGPVSHGPDDFGKRVGIAGICRADCDRQPTPTGPRQVGEIQACAFLWPACNIAVLNCPKLASGC